MKYPILKNYKQILLLLFIVALGVFAKPAAAADQYNELADTIGNRSALQSVEAYNQTADIFQVLFGDLAGCLSFAEATCSADGEGSVLTQSLALLVAIPVAFMPLIMLASLAQLAWTAVQTEGLRKNFGAMAATPLRMAAGYILAAPALFGPLNIVMTVTLFLGMLAIQGANLFYQKELNILENTPSLTSEPKIEALTMGLDLSQALACAAEYKNYKKGDLDWLDRNLLGKTENLDAYFARYIMQTRGQGVDGQTEVIIKDVFKKVGTATQPYETFPQPELSATSYLQRVDFGVDGACGSLNFEVPYDSWADLDSEERMYYAAIQRAQTNLLSSLNQINVSTQYFSQEALLEENHQHYALFERHQYPHHFTSGNYKEALFQLNREFFPDFSSSRAKLMDNMKKQLEERSKLLVAQSAMLNKSIENAVYSTDESSDEISEVFDEARRKGIFYASGYIGRILSHNDPLIAAHRAISSSMTLNSAPITCFETDEDDKRDICKAGDIEMAETYLKAVFSNGVEDLITDIARSPAPFFDVSELRSLQMTDVIASSALGGESSPEKGMDSIVKNSLQIVLSAADIGDEAGDKLTTINPFTFTADLGDSMIASSFTITAGALAVAAATGAAAAAPFGGMGIGAALQGIWQYVDGFVALISSAMLIQGSLLKYATQFILWFAVFSMGLRMIVRLVISVMASNYVPIALFMPSDSGQLGERLQRVGLMYISLLTRPLLDVVSMIAAVALLQLFGSLLIVNYFTFADLVFGNDLLAVPMMVGLFIVAIWSVFSWTISLIERMADQVEEIITGQTANRISLGDGANGQAQQVTGNLANTGTLVGAGSSMLAMNAAKGAREERAKQRAARIDSE